MTVQKQTNYSILQKWTTKGLCDYSPKDEDCDVDTAHPWREVGRVEISKKILMCYVPSLSAFNISPSDCLEM